MKSIVLLFGPLLISLFAGIANTQDADKIIVKITSSEPATPLTFTAAYVSRGSELQTIEAATPHLFEVDGSFFSGLFQQRTEGAILEVRLYRREGETEHEVLMGDGSVVVIHEYGTRRFVTSW